MPTDASTFMKDFFAGGISAAIAKTSVALIEKVKLILQVQAASNKLKPIPKEQDFFSLWRGNLANVLRYFPTQALNFAFKYVYKQIFMSGVDKKTQFWRYFAANLASGGAAGATSLCFVYPLDYARTRLGADVGKSSSERQYTGLIDCISKTVKSDGPVEHHISVSLLSGFQYQTGFGLILLKECCQAPKIHHSSFLHDCSGCDNSICCYDTVRNRMMMHSGRAKGDVMYKNTLDCWMKIAKNEGGTAFFKGAFSNILSGTRAALVLVFYDEVKNLL
ncbi:hypothetical protein WA026_010475 [Henosepilachna vigintioctopunctata]|uniref:ADP/ATP translocase n=1 Tax=Henosepilachna vigintioctopunctata TaxID=420089 RepID=A0AAW1VAC5_9CUCU